MKYTLNLQIEPHQRGSLVFWIYNYKKSIITKSFSKSHAMTGYRIGYVVAEAIHYRQNVKVTST